VEREVVEVVDGEYEVVKGWTPMLNVFSPPVSPRRERLLYQSFGEEGEGKGEDEGEGEGEGNGEGEEEAGMYVQWEGEGKDNEQEEQEGKE
jgi:hypothetical protein